jgi:exosortase/archaeosortase family protein
VVYWRDLEILANEAFQAEELSHVLLIPLFAGILLYWKRDIFKASISLDSMQKKSRNMFIDELIGLSLCLIAFLVYWYGSYTFYPLEYHLLSLPIFVSGIILVLFNLKALKAIIIPVALIIFLVPIPSEITYTLGGNLANFNTQASYTILKCFGVPATLNVTYGSPTIMLTKSPKQPISFTVGLQCSGIYTLTAFFMFAVFLLAVVQTSAIKKVGIFTLGFFIFEALNILRITAIVSAAYIFGEEIAMLIFHSAAGLILTFIGIFATLIASEKLLKAKVIIGRNETPPCPWCKRLQEKFQSFCLNCGRLFKQFNRKPSKIFWAKLTLLLIGCSILSLSVNAPVFAISKENIEVTSWEKATNILPQIANCNLIFLYRDTDYERVAKQDASLVYAYFPANLSSPVTYVLVNVANSISNLHNWEVCLISWQTAHGQYPMVKVLESKDIQLLEGSQLIAKYMIFQDLEQNYTQLTLYWYEKATFKIGATVQQKYVRISLIILTANSSGYRRYEGQLLDFGKAIAQYWEPIKTQSLFSLGVPAQQTILIMSVAFIIIAKATQSTREWRKRTNNLKIFNNFASITDKLVLEVITDLNRTKKAVTTAEINCAIKNRVGKNMGLKKLLERLNRLQEYGFIKMDIILNKNEPMLVWRNPIAI